MSADIPAVIEVVWRGVHEGAAPRYSAAQRQAWLPSRPSGADYAARLTGQRVWVATEDGVLTGFVTLRPDGYLDFAYVLPEMRGTGTADALLAMLENHARARALPRLFTRASDMARPFFARHGWTVIGPAPQTRAGLVLPATDMAKALTSLDAAAA